MDMGSQEPSSTEPPTRVEDLWFPDGGLVLQAEDRIFRVASGILAARSSVFRDMISIPQPEHQPLIEGCPIVVLHDSAIDTEYFLKAIFDSSFFERPPARTTFPILSGVLKLSTKYDVEYLRRRALLHLASTSPNSLEEYDSISLTSRDDILPRLLLANSMDVAWAMPAALYRVSCRKIEEIVDGIPVSTGSPFHLPSAIQRDCLIAHSALIFAQNHEGFRFLRVSRVDGCVSGDFCANNRHDILEACTKRKSLHPLGIIAPIIWADFLPTQLCSVCLPKAKEQAADLAE
ncbi:hypothetical protein B0H11DRAFT_2236720 [Mycena galericulata]|nr:hypothetical protein B0H11DRAFT_2236720 [Mycena galericulata]